MIGRAKILVVDDEESHCRLLAGILGRDYTVYTASSLDAAMAIVEQREVDVALVDYRMPGGVGTQILLALRNRQPSCLRFLVTAYADSQILQEAVNVGQIYRFVQKPVDPKFVRVDIQRALEHRRANDDLQRAARFAAIGRLASSVCHDLRNSLMATSLVPELISMGDAESQAMGVATLRRAQEQMRALTDELNALSRGGVPRYVLTAGQIAHVVQDSVEFVRHSAPLADRSIELEISADLPLINVSVTHCSRMLVNLLRNAGEATPASGRIGVRAFYTPTEVVCEVWDTGGGIPAELQPHIFEPLFSTKGDGGLGLGLWSCQTTMRAHGGTLTFRSEPGSGTAFVATFPRLDLPGPSSLVKTL